MPDIPCGTRNKRSVNWRSTARCAPPFGSAEPPGHGHSRPDFPPGPSAVATTVASLPLLTTLPLLLLVTTPGRVYVVRGSGADGPPSAGLLRRLLEQMVCRPPLAGTRPTSRSRRCSVKRRSARLPVLLAEPARVGLAVLGGASHPVSPADRRGPPGHRQAARHGPRRLVPATGGPQRGWLSTPSKRSFWELGVFCGERHSYSCARAIANRSARCVPRQESVVSNDSLRE